jgi:hypothetical protein
MCENLQQAKDTSNGHERCQVLGIMAEFKFIALIQLFKWVKGRMREGVVRGVVWDLLVLFE